MTESLRGSSELLETAASVFGRDAAPPASSVNAQDGAARRPYLHKVQNTL
jgi:hypothetical protein